MAEKSEEIKNTPSVQAPAVAAGGTASPENAPAATPKPERMIPVSQCVTFTTEEMSKGEKAYNWLVYKGMNYWLNLGMSMVITDFFTHGKGKPLFDKGVRASTKALMGTKVFNEKWADWLSRMALGTFSLNSGGNILVVPLKFLEDHKRKAVHWLNKNLYKDPQLGPDGREETPEQIHIVEEQPPQSWGNVIWRRLQGWAATTAVGMSLDATFKKKLDEPYFNEKGHEVTYSYGQDRLAGGIVDAMKNLPFGEQLLQYPWVKRYAFYASLDSIYTYITSSIMENTKGTKHIKTPKEIDDTRDPPGELLRDHAVVFPVAETQAAAKPVISNLESLKSKKPEAMASHVDHALKSSETSHLMAP